MAEEWGFEPQRPVTSLLAFQASPFNHLGIPPKDALSLYNTPPDLSLEINQVFRKQDKLRFAWVHGMIATK